MIQSILIGRCCSGQETESWHLNTVQVVCFLFFVYSLGLFVFVCLSSVCSLGLFVFVCLSSVFLQGVCLCLFVFIFFFKFVFVFSPECLSLFFVYFQFFYKCFLVVCFQSFPRCLCLCFFLRMFVAVENIKSGNNSRTLNVSTALRTFSVDSLLIK